MDKKLKTWQGWALFLGSMVVVFILGLLVSSLMERRAEVASVFNNKRTVFEDSIVAQNEKFKADYPREYETWAMTEDTTFVSKYNSSQEVDVDWLDLLAVQGTPKSLLQHHSTKASILRCSAFFTVQLSHPYMTTGKTIALTRWMEFIV